MAVCPRLLFSNVLLIDSSDARLACGYLTPNVVGAIIGTTGVGAVAPCSKAVASVLTSSGVKPPSRRSLGLVDKRLQGR